MRSILSKRAAIALMAAAGVLATAQPAWAQNRSDGTEFLEAVRKRDGTVATDMLNSPGNTLVNARNVGTGESALHIVTERRDLTWLSFLLGRGARPDIADQDGVTPLQLAARLGFIEGIEALAEAGATIDVTNDSGETPLMAAVHRRDVAMIRLLLAKGANPDRADNSGRSARSYAELMGASGAQIVGELDRADAAKSKQTKTYGPN